MRPVLHLTNWSSPKLHGPGRLFTLMAKPREWERGNGTVRVFVPPLAVAGDLERLLATRRRGEATPEAWSAVQSKVEAGWFALERSDAMAFSLGRLRVAGGSLLVEDGDSLLCCCARSEAAAGRCHRAWATPFLHRAGWTVLLDGVEWTPPVETRS